jgi:hypothetical protein
MLDRVWHWLVHADPAIHAIVGLLAIVASLYAGFGVIRAVARSPSWHSWTKLTTGWRDRVQPKLQCAVLRLNVLFARPDRLIRMLQKRRPDGAAGSMLAMALATMGKLEEAKAIDPGPAAWGVAGKSGLKDALHLLEPLKLVNSGAQIAYDGLSELVDPLRDQAALRSWQCHVLMAAPVARIADKLLEDRKRIKLPDCLDDVSRYLQSEPNIPVGWNKIRDPHLVRPVDKKRLRALRRVAAFKARCISMPEVATQIVILAQAEAASNRRFMAVASTSPGT